MAREQYAGWLPTWFDADAADDAFQPDLPWISTELSIQSDDDGGLIIWGEFFHNGMSVGTFERLISPIEEDGKVRLEAYHHGFYVSRELGYQKCGIATEALKKCLPYYRALDIRIVTISYALRAGKTVWPKFGFVLFSNLWPEYVDTVRAIYADKAHELLREDEVPTGPGFLENLYVPEVPDLAKIAIESMTWVGLDLDLEDPEALRCLSRRGIYLS